MDSGSRTTTRSESGYWAHEDRMVRAFQYPGGQWLFRAGPAAPAVRDAATMGRLSGLPMMVWLFVALIAVGLLSRPAAAGIVLSEVIVDLNASAPPRDDIEILNDGAERVYVAVEPAAIKAAGAPEEARLEVRDPGELGLLVSPNRLVLEPGQRKLVRIAALKAATDRDLIYRVTFRPVMGAIEANASGLKVLVGYDVLVIVRPPHPTASITAARSTGVIVFRNGGNTNAEMFGGRQCDDTGQSCVELPSHRLYAGAAWQVPLTRDTPVEFLVKVGAETTARRF
ncbi:MAG: fimbrial biogenesis chaperone [Dongiaceae bacterium]